MAAPNDPRQVPAPASGKTTPAPLGTQPIATARPDSTVTLMVQSGQAPGGLTPPQAPAAVPAKRLGPLAKAWAALKNWF